MAHPFLALWTLVSTFAVLSPAAAGTATAADFVISTEFGTMRSVCKPIPTTLALCHGIGYTEMRLPNLLGHDTAKEAQQQSGAWIPLVSKHCHRDTKKFLCSLFAPVCVPELTVPVRPCRSLCEDVRDGCLPMMSAFGFPWPEMFNCSRFPTGVDLCIPSSGNTGQREDAETKGTVICDACSLAAEGEKDVQQQFCSSQFAFKLRVGEVSVQGTDRLVVPVGRSRVLRWAGSEREQQEAMGQSALWLTEAAGCLCQALDGHLLSGPFLALGGMRGRRLVIARLVRWGRGEKELKKFIRSLLKLPC